MAQARGGLISPAGAISWQCASHVASAGTLLKMTTTAATKGVHGVKVDLCGAGEEPAGFAFTNTVNPADNTTTRTDEMVAMMSLEEGMIIDVPVPATHAAITLGARVETAADGKVTVESGAGWIVGTALEALAENTGTYVKIRVCKWYEAS